MHRLLKIMIATLITTVGTSALTSPAYAQTQSGDITIEGLVMGPPPSTAPTIEEPAGNVTFSTKSITVKGSCEVNLVIRVYRNNFFAGSALCQADGTYSMSIDLFVGENTLVARQFNSAGQASPDSNVVTVFYAPEQPTPQLPDGNQTPNVPSSGDSNTPADTPAVAQFQLIIDYDYTLQSIYTGTPFYLPIKFAGGTGPYAISVDWGDGKTDIFSRDNTTPFTVDHTYEKAGYYTVKIKISDSKGEEAALQFILLANGKPDSSLINQLRLPTDQLMSLESALFLGSGVLLFFAGVLFVGYRIGISRSKKV